MAVLPLIIGAVQAGLAVKKMVDENKRPEVKIPGEASESLAQARQVAQTTMLPGAERQKREVRRRASDTINAVTEKVSGSGDLVNTVSQVDRENRLANESINTASQEAMLKNKSFYASALANMANEKRRVQQIQDQQWMQRQAAISNLFGGAMQSLNAFSEREYTKDLWEGLGMGVNASQPYTPPSWMMEPTPTIPDSNINIGNPNLNVGVGSN